jgi:iron complex outermembrane receptor protein
MFHAIRSAALALLLVPAALAAQGASHGSSAGGSVQGMVVDSATGAPVAGAQVRVAALNRSEVSHAEGTFHLHRLPPGEHVLSVTRLGYGVYTTRVRVRGGEATALTVRLATSALELAGLVVTGTVTRRSRDEVLSATSTLSGVRLDREAGSTVAATLQGLPGVAATSIGPATARPVIRGLSSDRVLVLEDGQRPGDLSSTSGDHAVAIEGSTARQIDVVRGPMSLLYGSSALGGVVNVIREEVPTSLPQHPHGGITAGAATVDRSGTFGAFSTAALGSVALRAEATGRVSGEIGTPGGTLDNTQTRTLGFAGGASLVRDRGHAGAAYRFYDSEYGIPGGFTGAHLNGVDIRMRRHALRGEGELRPGAGVLSSLRGTTLFTDYFHEEVGSSGGVSTRFDQQTLSTELQARHNRVGMLGEGAMGLRAQYRNATTGGSVRTPSTYDWNVAGFLVEEVEAGRLRVQVGGRYDLARFVPREEATIVVGGERVPVRARTFGALSTSVGALYDVGGGLRAGASLARSFRTPDFNELYSNGPHLAAGTFDVGDPQLEQETGTGVEAFVRFARPALRMEAAAYRNQIDGFIFPSTRGRVEFGTSGGVARAQYTNEDARFTGFEVDGEWRAARALILEANASLVRAEFTSARSRIPIFQGLDTVYVEASRHPPLIPPLIGRAGARWERGAWTLAGGVRMAAEQDRVGDFEEPTDGYAVADASVALRLRRGAQFHSFTLRVGNLADAEYRNHLSRTKEIMPEPGRSVSLLYRITY